MKSFMVSKCHQISAVFQYTKTLSPNPLNRIACIPLVLTEANIIRGVRYNTVNRVVCNFF